MTASLLVVEGLRAGILAGLSLTIGAGEAVAVLGDNGAGKSTLLKALIGLVPATAGRIALEGRDITALPAERRARLGLGYVPEGRRVFPGMSVRDNLEVASFAPAAERRRTLDGVFALFPALAAKAHEPAWRLSGGQQQMLAIGRALMNRPRLLLLDEPGQGLSPKVVGEVFESVRAVARTGTAVLLADPARARAAVLAGRAVVLDRGRFVCEGRAADGAPLPPPAAAASLPETRS